MKSTLSKLASQKAITYPCLMVAENDGDVVVLFSSAGCGAVVYCNPDSIHEVGDFYESWEMGSFEFLVGEVKLSNQL